jgi:hypothetical protein
VEEERGFEEEEARLMMLSWSSVVAMKNRVE